MHETTQTKKKPTAPQGAGISLRSRHFDTFLSNKQPIDWLEVVADQFLNSQGILLEKLQRITQAYPINLHAVSLSLASSDPINMAYLKQILKLAEQLNAYYISDHLCWSSYNNQYSHDLLPFPYSKNNLLHVANRIDQIQQISQRPLLIENLSHYVDLNTNERTEANALNYLCQQTGCGLLLDINNVYVTCYNLNINAKQWLKAIDPTHVKQIHLAGHHSSDGRLIDTHGSAVNEAVWSLYQYALKQFGPVPTCLEWDSNIPPWPVMLEHNQKIKQYLQQCLSTHEPKKNITEKKIMPHHPPESLRLFQDKIWINLHDTTDISNTNPWSVHQNSIRIQRLISLQSTFPCTEKKLGKKLFKQLGIAYLLKTPSKHPDISSENHQFCQFIKHANLDLEILELAQFEWHWYLSFHSPNHTNICLESLAKSINQYQENMLIKQTNGLQLLYTSTNAQHNWALQQDELEINNHPSDKEKLNPNNGHFYTLHQRHGRVIVNEIGKVSYACLAKLNQPMTLEQWVDLCATDHDTPPHLAAQLYQFGLIQLHTHQEEI